MVNCSIEVSERGNRLIVWDLVSSLIDAEETEVAILAYFAILDTIHKEWLVPSGSKLRSVGIING